MECPNRGKDPVPDVNRLCCLLLCFARAIGLLSLCSDAPFRGVPHVWNCDRSRSANAHCADHSLSVSYRVEYICVLLLAIKSFIHVRSHHTRVTNDAFSFPIHAYKIVQIIHTVLGVIGNILRTTLHVTEPYWPTAIITTPAHSNVLDISSKLSTWHPTSVGYHPPTPTQTAQTAACRSSIHAPTEPAA